MEPTDREIILYMTQDQDWHLPSEILKETCLKGRNPEEQMTIQNIIKRCRFLTNNGFLKTPDPNKDRAMFRMKQKGIYCIREGLDTFKTLVTEFIGTPDTEEFFNSAYCQNLINSELVEKIKTEWKYPKNIDIEKGYRVVPSRTIKGGTITDGETIIKTKDSDLSDEQVREILRLSPSALCSLFSKEYTIDGFLGPIKADEKFESARLDEVLILNLLLDLRKYHRGGEVIGIFADTQIKINLYKRTGTEMIDILGKHADFGKIITQKLTIKEIIRQREEGTEEERENRTKYYTIKAIGHY